MKNMAKKEMIVLQKQILREEAHAILQLYHEEKVNQNFLEIMKEDLKLKKLVVREFYYKCLMKRAC